MIRSQIDDAFNVLVFYFGQFCYLTLFEGHESICIIVLQNFITILVFMEAWFCVDVFLNKTYKTSWPLWRVVSLFPSRNRGFRIPVTWLWTKDAPRNTRPLFFQAVLRVLSGTLVLRVAKKTGAIFT